jgi:hypothetical protein
VNWQRRSDNRACYFTGKRAAFVKVVFWQGKKMAVLRNFSLACGVMAVRRPINDMRQCGIWYRYIS